MRPQLSLSGLFLALCALPPGLRAQAVQHSPDVDITLPLGPNTSYGAAAYQTFDADWTADGRLAFAVVRRQYSGKWPSDTLVIGLHDPATGDSRVLGSFTGPSWTLEHVALAVPERYHDEEGTGGFDGTTPIHDRNRVFVALGAEAPVWPSWDGSTYPQRVRVVRLLSVSFTDEDPELRLASPPDLVGKPVPVGAEPPRPELALRGLEKGYAVELVFVDPHNPEPLGGQVMQCSSYDLGASLGKVGYVTGPCSPAGGDAETPLSGARFAPRARLRRTGGRPPAAGAGGPRPRGRAPGRDAGGPAGLRGRGLDPQGRPGTPRPAHGGAHRPGERDLPGRSAQLQGRAPAGLVQQLRPGRLRPAPAHHRAGPHERGIEVRGNTAFIVVRRSPDQGSSDSEVVSFDMKRTDPFDTPKPVRVNDVHDNDSLRVVSAVTPEHALLSTVRSAVFRYELGYADHHSGLMRDD